MWLEISFVIIYTSSHIPTIKAVIVVCDCMWHYNYILVVYSIVNKVYNGHSFFETS